jgi:hypothetical protein
MYIHNSGKHCNTMQSFKRNKKIGYKANNLLSEYKRSIAIYVILKESCFRPFFNIEKTSSST